MNQAMIDYITDAPQHRGRAHLLRHLQGKRLTLAQAIEAHCYECSIMGMGPVDCGVPECPLYPYAPYSALQAPRRALSEATRVKLQARPQNTKKPPSKPTGGSSQHKNENGHGPHNHTHGRDSSCRVPHGTN